MMVWACFKPSIWSDEAFSLLLIKKSYLDVIAVTSMDVHPPLYYFILKFVVSLFQSFNLTPNSVIILGRFVSVVPFVLLLILDLFKVREYWGWLCCGVFAVCLTSMPQLMHFAVEIRMYSWALFFVTVCFIYAYEITHNFNVPNWIIFLFSGVCAAYTHYFAAISVIIIYLLIFNQLRIRKWVISVIASLTLYLFWLFVLIHQLIKVTANFWIEPITIDVVFSYLWFIVSPSNIFHPSIELIGVLLVISYLIVFIYYFIKCGYENQNILYWVVLLF